MRAGDICLAHFPFGGRVGSKLRPVLVLTPPTGPVPELLVAYVSSVIPPAALVTDLIADPSLPEYAATGLKVRSVVRLHKLATIHRSDIARRLGTISPATPNRVRGKLRLLLKL